MQSRLNKLWPFGKTKTNKAKIVSFWRRNLNDEEEEEDASDRKAYERWRKESIKRRPEDLFSVFCKLVIEAC